MKLPKRVHSLRDWGQVRAMADPTRMQMLQAMAGGSMTTIQLARKLGAKPTALYHHMAALEEAGLVELVETRQKRGFVEKLYRAIADDFVFDRRLLALTHGRDGGRGSYGAMFIGAIEATLEEVRSSAQSGALEAADPSNCTILRLSPVLDATRAAELREELAGVVSRYDVEGAEGERYGLTLALYPVVAQKAAKRQTKRAKVGGRTR
jgi:DNA-binding transcriptional ArsR family regulator